MERLAKKQRQQNRSAARKAKRQPTPLTWGSGHIVPDSFDAAEAELRTFAYLDQQNKRAE